MDEEEGVDKYLYLYKEVVVVAVVVDNITVVLKETFPSLMSPVTFMKNSGAYYQTKREEGWLNTP